VWCLYVIKKWENFKCPIKARRRDSCQCAACAYNVDCCVKLSLCCLNVMLGIATSCCNWCECCRLRELLQILIVTAACVHPTCRTFLSDIYMHNCVTRIFYIKKWAYNVWFLFTGLSLCPVIPSSALPVVQLIRLLALLDDWLTVLLSRYNKLIKLKRKKAKWTWQRQPSDW